MDDIKNSIGYKKMELGKNYEELKKTIMKESGLNPLIFNILLKICSVYVTVQNCIKRWSKK